MSKKIIVILGSTDDTSFCASIAKEYVLSAEAAGNRVKFFKLGEVEFDPILRDGYKKKQALEPDLVKIKEAISWSDHIVLVYPIWWGSLPTVLKGMFDRIFLPGYAFKYRKGSQLWDKLLKGRSAHAITTMDTPPWYFKLIYRNAGHNQMRKNILEFSGIKPVKITSFGPVRFSSEPKRKKWLNKVNRWAKAA